MQTDLVSIDTAPSAGLKGCNFIYAPKGQAGEYAPLAANPYRGCGHACSYCLSGETLIQMADGSTKKISGVSIGDSVIGVVSKGGRSWGTRIKTTVVLAKVESVKAAYRVTLEDGTTAICSADHRWLTERGWKYTATISSKRPVLTTNNVIRKLGTAVLTPPESDSYRLGYIAGMIEGDGSIGIYRLQPQAPPIWKNDGDSASLPSRAQRYLWAGKDSGVPKQGGD